jgi:DNA mismatch endonuclease (patch repair protein)
MSKSTKRRKTSGEIARNMSAIRSSNNRTETLLRSALFQIGLRYRIHAKNLIGKPDLVFPASKVAVFVDGDYWHGRQVREAGIESAKRHFSKRQQAYWLPKLRRNIVRDDLVTRSLESEGWRVLRFWESDVKNDLTSHRDKIADVVRARMDASRSKGVVKKVPNLRRINARQS